MCVKKKPRNYGFTLGEEKCKFFLLKITYLGEIINKNIAPAPNNYSDRTSFLGEKQISTKCV